MDSRGSARDADIGLDGFLTSTPGLGGRLKVRVEDFIVEEVGGLPPENPTGPFTCAVVRLENWETNRFVGAASERLQMSRKKIHFSGTKDKRGVTTQAFTFEALPEAVRSLERLPGVHVERTFRTDRESSLGDHVRNRFRIVVRRLEGSPEELREIVEGTQRAALAAGGFPNVFGPQRFGALRATTHKVGECIVRGDFRGAVLAYLDPPPTYSEEDRRVWREGLAREAYSDLLRLTRADQGFERTLLHGLLERPGDYVHAIQGLPHNLQYLFVYAYQSFLFNRIVMRRLREGLGLGVAIEGDLVAPVEAEGMGEEWIPVRDANLGRVNEELRRGRAVVTGLLPGTHAPLATGRPGDIESSVLGEANIRPADFVVPEHLEWSSKGTRRALTLRPLSFEFQVNEDDLHPGERMVTMGFELPRGSYATSVLREFLKSPVLSDYA